LAFGAAAASFAASASRGFGPSTPTVPDATGSADLPKPWQDVKTVRMDGSKNPPGAASASQALYQPSQEDRILNLMRPLRTEEAELAPDGKHLAYVEADPYRVQLIIIDLDNPEARASVDVGRGDWWQRLKGSNWSSPRVVFLRWATAKRLIFSEATNGIFAVNADGKGLTKLVTSQDVGIRKGKDLSILAQSAPAGMAIAPNQLDLMAGSPPTNLDPAFLSASRSNTSGFGMINGQTATAGAFRPVASAMPRATSSASPCVTA